ncbi:MAG: heparinase II/III family protein [Hyphomicrobiales bacterium]|jgi:uncharacterized heparinase superfamily protein|nr:heparinase II/III family protein [Hyphomicrobiales bacterium]
MNPFGRFQPTSFLFAPPDLRTADPTVAAEIYAGQFAFAGRSVATNGASPFAVPAPSASWEEALYGFGWLRHLQAGNSALARDNARTLVSDFLARGSQRPAIARQPKVAARRLIAFLAHSAMLLDDATHGFYQSYLGAVRSEAKLLRTARSLTDDPVVHLDAALALTLLGLCVEGGAGLERRYGRLLSDMLDVQVLSDGGHLSRNPRVLVDLMLDLLPLRSTYAARGAEAPRGVISAIDRIVPHLKMMRHPDGSIALFNGMGASQVDALATIFASHDSRGRAATEAPYTGYQRLEANGAVLIADTGPAPPFALSADAMAGCLSFEFSHGRERIIVNCGAPRGGSGEVPVELKSTAAHNTPSFADTSSCAFISLNGQIRILHGPRAVTLARSTSAQGETLDLCHDGYRKRYGFDIRRQLAVGLDGLSIRGQESCSPAPRSPGTADGLVTRFHLHPSVRAEPVTANEVRLVTARGAVWHFTGTDAEVTLDDSMFFAGIEGPRRTRQIVLRAFDAGTGSRWQMRRAAG